MSIRVAFLDRDGTIIEKAGEGDYTSDIAAVRLLPGAAAGIRALNDAGFRCIVITNQRGVALGRMSAADYRAVHRRMLHLLAADKAEIAAEYHCFHGIGECDCRKPATGLLEQAARQIEAFDPSAAVMIGDAESDIACAARFGIASIRISDRGDPNATYTAADLVAAASWAITMLR